MPEFTTTETVTVDFSVYCGICGSGVCNDTTVDDRKKTITVTCSKCADKINALEAEVDALERGLNE